MENLEELSLGYIYSPKLGLSATDCAQATIAVIQSISHCSRLKTLALELRTYTEQLDQALATCVSLNSSLDKISMKCMNTKFLEEHERINTPLSFPAVLNALRSSCSVQCIEFEPDWLVRDDESMDPWDPDSVNALNFVLRLNRSGRSYIKSAPTNVRRACKVLAAVSDDLDCLNFHIRENPQIFAKLCANN
jgi:hypothetical protein